MGWLIQSPPAGTERIRDAKETLAKVTHVHPNPRERCRTLNETHRLLRMGLWEAMSLGIAVGIAAPNVLDLLDSLFTLLPPQIAASGVTDFETFGAALLFALLIVVVAGLGTWRTTFAALARGQVPLGILGLDLLFGGTIHPDFAWTLLSWVINGGALLALPVALTASTIAHLIRKANREVVTS